MVQITYKLSLPMKVTQIKIRCTVFLGCLERQKKALQFILRETVLLLFMISEEFYSSLHLAKPMKQDPLTKILQGVAESLLSHGQAGKVVC